MVATRVLRMTLACSLTLTVCVAIAGATDGESPDDHDAKAPAVTPNVQVTVDEVPDDCDRKTKWGDVLELYYSGFVIDPDTLEVTQALSSSISDDGNEDTETEAEPLMMQIGKQDVIRGIEQGTLDMCVGEMRTLIIPPSLGYGDEPSMMTRVPPNATLKFIVALLDIQDGPAQEQDEFLNYDLDKDGWITVAEVELKFLREAQAGVRRSKDDLDQNGLITADEFPGNAEQFASLDTDGSGGLDFEEAVAGFGRGDAGKARSMIAEMDADKDGMLSWEEITGPKGPPPKTVGPRPGPAGPAATPPADDRDEL